MEHYKNHCRAVILCLAMLLAFGAAPAFAAQETENIEVIDDSYIYLGSYPQAEVVRTRSDSGSYGKDWMFDDDLIVSESIYKKLEKESIWDENDDAVVGGDKYHRMTGHDATCVVRGNRHYYDWEDMYQYHYFKYQPVKWMIWEMDEETGDAYVMSEKMLDCRPFDKSSASTMEVTWADSYMRRWLNGEFMNMTFNEGQKRAIKLSTIKNNGNADWNVEASEDTEDNIFLMSLDELYEYTGEGEYQGSRVAFSSGYAKAMGTSAQTSDLTPGVGSWLLRSPGSSYSMVANVQDLGNVDTIGVMAHLWVGSEGVGHGVRPAMRIDLNADVFYEEADPVDIGQAGAMELSETSYIYTGEEIRPQVTIGELEEGTDYELKYLNNIETGTGMVVAAGKGNYTGTVYARFVIKPQSSSISKITPAAKKMTVKMKLPVADTGGVMYQIQYRAKGSSSDAVKTTDKQSLTIKSLRRGRKYQVRVRAYRDIDGIRYYGSWSKVVTSGKIK